jgi:hypothetical protein
MSKATPAATRRASAPDASAQSGTTPARRTPCAQDRPATTPGLIARIWDTLEWRKTLQVAFIIAVTGITITLMLTGLGLLAHTMPGQTPVWPIGASILTVTVTYRAARRRRR